MAVNGILGIKLGMTQVFAEDGTAVPCTVLQAGPCVVVQRRTKNTDGYEAVQLGLVEFIKPQRVNKARTGHFKKANVAPLRYLKEIRIDDAKDEAKSGDRVLVENFKVGELVDVTGVSKGRGFQGGVKRWTFRGVEGAAFSGAHGQRAQDFEEFAGGESGFRREPVAGARRSGGAAGQLHFYSQG